jgi:cytochrome c peroxidase
LDEASRRPSLFTGPLRAAAPALAGLAALAAATAAVGQPAPARDGEPISPLPLTVAVDPARAALGARLFNETQLSRNGRQSCASCHPLDRGGVDGLARAPSASPAAVLRNTPTVFNSGFNLSFNWDGSARTLEEQADGVIRSPAQFANDWPTVLGRLRADAGYAAAFKAAYPDGLTQRNVLDALGTYQRSLVTPNGRFDKFLRGGRDALTSREQEGWRLFKAIGCVACHQGMNVGGNLYEKFGVFRDTKPGRRQGEAPDLGRFAITGQEADREVFRVPSLRNVALTPPYFHDGRAATLADAVRTMGKVQLNRDLQPGEIDAIVQFLGTLTGEYGGRPLSVAASVSAPVPASASAPAPASTGRAAP